jgi:hypothetical protein
VSDPDKIIDDLISKGGLEFVGIDPESGEALYRPTDILKNIDPKLSDEMSTYFSESVMTLWQKGFVDMDVTVADPLVKLAEKSFDANAISSLGKEERIIVQEIIRVLSEKK